MPIVAAVFLLLTRWPSFQQGHGTIYASEHTTTAAYKKMVDELTPFVAKLHEWIDDKRVAPWTSRVMGEVSVFKLYCIVKSVCVSSISTCYTHTYTPVV